VGRGARRAATAGTAAGLLLVVAGLYGVLVAGSLPGGGVPFVAVGAVLLGAGLATSGRRTNRTRYRPDPWRGPEWIVSSSGVAAVGTMVAAGVLGVPGIEFVTSPLGPPTLPVLAAVGILIGLVPAWAAPVEPGAVPIPDGNATGSGDPAPQVGAAA